MRCQPPRLAVAFLCVAGILAGILAGCAPQQPMYFRGNSDDVSHYLGMSETIDNPDLPEPPFSEVEGTVRPYSIAGPAPKEYWTLTLEDAIRYALQNAKVMRQIGGQVQGPPSFLTSNPNAAPTIYDPAITATDARFGINAGLSLFDPQLNMDLFWERNHDPRNVNQSFVNSGTLGPDLNQDLAEFDTSLSKTTADGTVLTVSTSTAYDNERDNPTVEFQSDYQTSFQMEIRRPLLQGYGVEFNRIAGPGAIPGFNQGVLIARVNTDIALTAFEAGVRNLVSDVETIYWELFFEYHALDASVQGRDSALKMWQKIDALYKKGGTDASSEAQAREQYFVFRSQAEEAQGQLYQTESKLRYMMGIAATDGRLIRPADDPTTAKISFDWCQVQSEAMARSVEIREQRWRVKQRELELIAAKNYLLPRVDLDARYTWTGLGDKLVDPGNSNITGGSFDNLGSGQFQSWHIGVLGQIPIGFRKQRDGVTNAELALARERAKLRETELEVSHQVAFALSDMEANLVLTATNFNRRLASQRNVEANLAIYEGSQNNIDTLNILLNAQRSLAQAESDYYRSATNYAKSISQVHFRKGSLLEYNGVYLTEGPWPAKAYFDARRRARSRSAAVYLDYGFTYPKVLSRGPNPQFGGQAMGTEDTPANVPPVSPNGPGRPEVLPAPQAQPSGMGPAVQLAPPPSSTSPSQPPAAPLPPVNLDAPVAARPSGRTTHDLGFLDLSSLAAKADAASGVKQAGYQGQ